MSARTVTDPVRVQATAGDPIRGAEAEDLAAIAAIFCTGQAEHHSRFPDIFCAPTDRLAIERYVRAYLKPQNPFRTRTHFAWVWQDGKKPAGYLLFQWRQTSDIFFGDERWSCFVDDIAVAPDARGQGIARALLAHLVALANTKPGCLMGAQVWRGNAASHDLFEKAGFTAGSQNFQRVIPSQ
ncbi:MAG: GNAT family N-acetyltransferase [Pseudomonadota bacterium]